MHGEKNQLNYLSLVCLIRFTGRQSAFPRLRTWQTSTVFLVPVLWNTEWQIHPNTPAQTANRLSLSAWRWLQSRDINVWWQNVSCGHGKCVACRHEASGCSVVLRISGASARKRREGVRLIQGWKQGHWLYDEWHCHYELTAECLCAVLCSCPVTMYSSQRWLCGPTSQSSAIFRLSLTS